MDAFIIVLGIFAVFLAFQSIKIVPQQNAWVIERFGKYNRSLEPGLNIVIPFMDRVAYRHRYRVSIDIAPQICITRDNTSAGGRRALLVTDAARAGYLGYRRHHHVAQTALRSECGKRHGQIAGRPRAINRTVVFHSTSQ